MLLTGPLWNEVTGSWGAGRVGGWPVVGGCEGGAVEGRRGAEVSAAHARLARREREGGCRHPAYSKAPPAAALRAPVGGRAPAHPPRGARRQQRAVVARQEQPRPRQPQRRERGGVARHQARRQRLQRCVEQRSRLALEQAEVAEAVRQRQVQAAACGAARRGTA
jgi:hypothetical protein